MRFLRIDLGYALACVAAMAVLFSAQGNTVSVGSWDIPTTWSEIVKTAQAMAFFSTIVAGIMFIPALIFLTVAWGKRGPSLPNCLLFGGLGGFLVFVILLSLGGGSGTSSNDSNIGLIIATTFTAAGLVAALTFWVVAVWPRPPVLLDDATSPKPTP